MSSPQRFSGILLSPASLPGRFGMGELGVEAQRWVEWLARLGQPAWVFPPMQCFDGCAGDPLLLSFDSLRMDGVLLPSDLAMLPAFNPHRINVRAVSEVRHAFLHLAARRFLQQAGVSPLLEHAFDKFCDAEAGWLDDWALHAALTHDQENQPWREWPQELARRDPGAMAAAMVRHAAAIEEHKVLQFLFARHWQRLRAFAHDAGVRLVGTLGAKCDPDSAFAWAMPSLLEKDDRGWWRSQWQAMRRRFDAVRLLGEIPQSWRESLEDPVFDESSGVIQDWRAVMGDEAVAPDVWRFTWEEVTSEVEQRLSAGRV